MVVQGDSRSPSIRQSETCTKRTGMGAVQVESPRQEDVECLIKLLNTIGSQVTFLPQHELTSLGSVANDVKPYFHRKHSRCHTAMRPPTATFFCCALQPRN